MLPQPQAARRIIPAGYTIGGPVGFNSLPQTQEHDDAEQGTKLKHSRYSTRRSMDRKWKSSHAADQGKQDPGHRRNDPDLSADEIDEVAMKLDWLLIKCPAV